MIGKIIKNLKVNYVEILITFCLFSNLYPYIFPSFLYIIGVFLLALKILKYNVSFVSQNTIYVFFIAIICLSSIINLALDLRLILFVVILIVTGPFLTSIRWHLYKKKLMGFILKGFACTVIISLIAKLMGINYQVLYNFRGISAMMYGGVDEFSGFAKFPMWNSAAAAISTIYFAYLLFKGKSTSLKYKWGYIVMLLASMYVCIISASRSAFAFSVLSSVLLFYWLSFNVKTIVKYLVILGALGILLFPFYMESAIRMVQKQETQEKTGESSRDALWAKRMEEFESSPVFGVGFAVNGVGMNKKIGRDESGSSWLAILAQTGVIGFIIALILWFKTFVRPKKIKYDMEYTLIYALVCFFTFHSIFEGYMFQGGWYMCVICWMCLGLLNEAQIYKHKLVML